MVLHVNVLILFKVEKFLSDSGVVTGVVFMIFSSDTSIAMFFSWTNLDWRTVFLSRLNDVEISNLCSNGKLLNWTFIVDLIHYIALLYLVASITVMTNNMVQYGNNCVATPIL